MTTSQGSRRGGAASVCDGDRHRAGFVAILGLPNVGKSTLLNALVGERLGIVTAKAQTTRKRLRAIYTDDAHQAVFIDTPGLLDPRYALHRAMREEALAAAEEADVAVLVVDAGFDPSIAWAREFARELRTPGIACVNKVDRVSPRQSAELVAEFGRPGEGVGEAESRGTAWAGAYAAEATTGRGVDALRAAVLGLLPESPPLYPVDEVSDAPVREFAAEIIRETCLEELSDEVPYAVAVVIEEFRERGGGRPTYVEAVLHVERASQKGILVGAGGRTIRRLGTISRRKIERFLGQRVYLKLRVKVLPNWRRRKARLRLLGFRVPADDAG